MEKIMQECNSQEQRSMADLPRDVPILKKDKIPNLGVVG